VIGRVCSAIFDGFVRGIFAVIDAWIVVVMVALWVMPAHSAPPDCGCVCLPTIQPVPPLPAMRMVRVPALASGIIPDEAEHYMRQLEREARAEFGLNAPVALLAAQLHQESRWNPNAKSSAAAQGLAQFMPRTAVWIAEVYPELAPADPWDASWSIRAQVRYMSYLHKRITGATSCDRWAFSLSSYNGGLGNLRKDQALTRANGGISIVWADVAKYSGRNASAMRENRGYVQRITQVLEPLYLNAGWSGERTCY
jgi:soluble lytic murein transglycosylase-like protein